MALLGSGGACGQGRNEPMAPEMQNSIEAELFTNIYIYIYIYIHTC